MHKGSNSKHSKCKERTTLWGNIPDCRVYCEVIRGLYDGLYDGLYEGLYDGLYDDLYDGLYLQWVLSLPWEAE